jgi:hypothetical protein
MTTQHTPPPVATGSFSDRIKLLIQRVGSATEIARLCGFSEGVVRSWRDGNTDPSRARCVTLAKTLGISLVWLVAGEGAIQTDSPSASPDEQYSTDVVSTPRPRTRLASVSLHPAIDEHGTGIDIRRLDTAMKMLQSELELTDGKLTLVENTDMLTELYGILGPGGNQVDTLAMLTFNRRLAERIKQLRATA